jgi:hypothetical protein
MNSVLSTARVAVRTVREGIEMRYNWVSIVEGGGSRCNPWKPIMVRVVRSRRVCIPEGPGMSDIRYPHVQWLLLHISSHRPQIGTGMRIIIGWMSFRFTRRFGKVPKHRKLSSLVSWMVFMKGELVRHTRVKPNYKSDNYIKHWKRLELWATLEPEKTHSLAGIPQTSWIYHPGQRNWLKELRVFFLRLKSEKKLVGVAPETKRTLVSKGSKRRDIGLPRIQPRITMTLYKRWDTIIGIFHGQKTHGKMKSAICCQE